jgi:hypothetical protein
LAAPADPHFVAGCVQLHALMEQFDGRAIKARAVTQIAVRRDANDTTQREVKGGRRQRPQPGAILEEAVSDDELPRGVAALMRNSVSPVAVDPIQFIERLEAPRGPETAL